MQCQDNADVPAHGPHAPLALFDECGRISGWSPEFGDEFACSSREIRDSTVADFWPGLDAARWAQIWERAQDEGPFLIEALARCRADERAGIVELEICRFAGKAIPLLRVEVGHAAARRLRVMQQEILESMANGVPLKEIMEGLCRRAEAMAPTVTCSVLGVNDNRQLCHLASPSLPLHYSQTIDGMLIGPIAGSCGTAAFRGEPVEVHDIAADPLWHDYRELALPLGLRACWSSPIRAPSGRVLGVFAFYFEQPRGPTALERSIVATCLNLCAIALDREEARSRAYRLAFTDPLTHLANRARFQQRVGEGLAIVAETGQRVAVLYIGLDHFRSLNETVGYAAGDEILKIVAARLHSLVKDHDTVARAGGDEFALMQIGDLREAEIADRAREVIALIAQPFLLGGQRIVLGASVGIACGATANASELIQDAALTMRRVKEVGRGGYMFHEKELNERMQARHRVELDLRDALARQQLELHYQPIFDLDKPGVRWVEALLRWRHPHRGMVPPHEFIPLAEESRLIEELGGFALQEACRTAAKWPSGVGVAVNLSPRQFDRPGLVERVVAALVGSGLAPSRLELEITESVLLHDNAVNVGVLLQLAELGVSIALDDFGTGYSSLSYLHRFRFDRIKVDHSFVRDIDSNAGSQAIVRAIVMLAHSLGLTVTAEGVETKEQLSVVRAEGCDAVQGFLTGAPVPAETLQEMLRKLSLDHVSAA